MLLNKKVMFGKLVISIFISSFMFTYVYPNIYNFVQKQTGRGEPLDDKVDLINSLIMSSLYTFTIYLTLVVTMGVFVSFFKK